MIRTVGPNFDQNLVTQSRNSTADRGLPRRCGPHSAGRRGHHRHLLAPADRSWHRAQLPEHPADASSEHAGNAGLGEFERSTVGGLPYGVQKRIELVRALMAQPRLLLLDEPAAGLNAAETDALQAQLEKSARG